jgi:hypothetical protein
MLKQPKEDGSSTKMQNQDAADGNKKQCVAS